MINKDKVVTLFLIEDDDVDAMAIQRALEKGKIANPVIRAHDGIEAMEMLKSGQIEKPFVILLDLQMPRMNGLEFLDAIRADEKFSDSVIFILSTSKSDEDLFRSYKMKVAGYFLKEDTGVGFMNVVELLNGYWRLAYLPMD